MLKIIRYISVFLLGLVFVVPISGSAFAESPINYNPSGDSGALYDGYISYTSPSIKPNPPRVIQSLVKTPDSQKAQVLSSEVKAGSPASVAN